MSDELQAAYERHLETFYSPTQKRDRKGQWTRGGGSDLPDTSVRRKERLDELEAGWTSSYGPFDRIPSQLDSLGEFWRQAKDRGDMTVRIRIPASVAARIAADGEIKNQHETGISGGLLNPDGRARHEDVMFGAPVRPIYGYVHVEGYKRDITDVAMYGEFGVVLNKNALDRSYLTVGDSLNVSDPPAPLAIRDLDTMKGPDVGRAILAASSDKYTGYAVSDLEKRRTEGNVSYDRIVSQARYIEAQIVGGIKLSDIDHVIVPTEYRTRKPPVTTHMKELYEQEMADMNSAITALKAAGVRVVEIEGERGSDFSVSPLLAAARRRAAQEWLGGSVEGLTATMVDEILELACRDASCAPPPVGTGGSKPSGVGIAMRRAAAETVVRSGTHEQRVAFAESLFNHDLPLGYSSMIEGSSFQDGVLSVDRGTLVVEGAIRSPDNDVVGHFERSIKLNGSRIIVDHDTLVLDPNHQGMGIAQAFTSQAITQYREIGVERIEVLAAMEVGAFAWARQNYQFDERHDQIRKQWVEDRLLWVKKVADDGTKDKWTVEDAAQMRKAAQDLINASNRGERIQPIHIASLGEQRYRWTETARVVDDSSGRMMDQSYETWPGKEVLLNWGNSDRYGDPSWSGVKYLDDRDQSVAAGATEIEEFYDPSQPRDKDGKWTRTPGAKDKGSQWTRTPGVVGYGPLDEVGVRGYDGEELRNAEGYKYHGPRHVADSMDPELRAKVTADLLSRSIDSPSGRDNGFNGLVDRAVDLSVIPQEGDKPWNLGLVMQVAHLYESYSDPKSVGSTWETSDRIRDVLSNEALTHQQMHDKIYKLTGVDATTGLIGGINRSWQISASDTLSVAAHLMVEKIHDVSDGRETLATYMRDDRLAKSDAVIADIGESNMKAVVDATYAVTQRELARLFPDEPFTIYRGVTDDASIIDSGEAWVKPSPLSSWSTSSGVAGDFAGDGWILEIRNVPHESIYSIATITGMGSLIEQEIILIGHEQRVEAFRGYDD